MHVSTRSSVLKQWFLMVLHPGKAGGIKSEIYRQIMKWVVLMFAEEREHRPFCSHCLPSIFSLKFPVAAAFSGRSRQKYR